MFRRCLTLFGLAVTGFPCRVSAQDSAHAHLVAARAHLRAARLDSAALLLREALDTAGHPARPDQVEAWMLLGVTSFFKGNDSGTSEDFRRALALDPQLKGDGLAGYDSALVDLFNAQRGAIAAGEPSRTPEYTLVDCTLTCPENVVLPRLIAVEALEGLAPDRFAVEHHRYGTMIVQLIVDPAGKVAPASVRLVSSNLQMEELQRALLVGLERMTFTPGRASGRPIPVLVRGKLGFLLERFAVELPIVPKRRPR